MSSHCVALLGSRPRHAGDRRRPYRAAQRRLHRVQARPAPQPLRRLSQRARRQQHPALTGPRGLPKGAKNKRTVLKEAELKLVNRDEYLDALVVLEEGMRHFYHRAVQLKNISAIRKRSMIIC